MYFTNDLLKLLLLNEIEPWKPLPSNFKMTKRSGRGQCSKVNKSCAGLFRDIGNQVFLSGKHSFVLMCSLIRYSKNLELSIVSFFA